MGILLVPEIVQDAEAMTETECLDAVNLSASDLAYTVVTCANPFDVTVEIGQRLHIQNPNGGSSNMLPSATYSGYGAPGSIPGVYQFSQNIGGETVTGSINIVNPSINTGFNNISLVMDGSSHTITFEPLTVPASMDKIKLYTIFVDSSGSYMTSRYDTVDNFNANELYTLTGCCASGNIANVNLYISQAWNSDGTQVITPDVDPGSSQMRQLTIDSFEI